MSTPSKANFQPDIPPPPPPAEGEPAKGNTQPPAPASSARWKVAGISTLVVVALALTSGFFFMGYQAAHAPRVSPPKLSKTAEVPNLGGNIEIKPFSPDIPLLINGGTLLARVSDGKNESLIGVDLEKESEYPRLQVPIPDDLADQALDCSASGGLIDCGEHLRIDVEKGVNTASESVVLSAGLTQNEGGEAAKEGSGEETQSQSQGAAQSSGGAQSGENATNTHGSVRVLEQATEQVPLAIDEGKSLTVNGEKLENLSFDPATTWAKKVSVPRRIFGAPLPIRQDGWIVSDGTTVAHIVDKEIRWSIQLPEGSAALNGFTANGGPKWIVDNEDFILATPDSIKAFDTLTGELLWDVKGTVNSWMPTDGGIVVSSGSTISFMTLDQTGEKANQSGSVLAEVPGSQSAVMQAQSAQSGDEAASGQSARTPTEKTPRNVLQANDGGGQQKPAPWMGSTGGIDFQKLQNSTLDIPKDCFVGGAERTGGPTPGEFIDGVATGPSDFRVPPTATMTEIVPAVFNGQPVAIVTIACYGGGNMVYEVLAVYNSSFELIGSINFNEVGYPGRMHNLDIEGVRTVGNTVVLEVPNIVIPGDTDCRACGGSASATIVAEWTGEALVVRGRRFNLPGQTIHAPPLKEVQKVYDALVTGDAQILDQQVSPEMLKSISSNWGGETPPKNARVQYCALADGVSLPDKALVRGANNPGDIKCAFQAYDEQGNPRVAREGQTQFIFLWLTIEVVPGQPIRVVDYEIGRS